MRTLVARLDSDGDVLLAGPAIRAAATAGEVVLLCGPAGAQAAELLPGVTRVVRWACPWIANPAPDVRGADIDGLVALLKGLRVDVALVLTSFHQSPLPLALLLRLAGVPRIVARSVDYPGSLLDVRLREDPDVPEAERALEVAVAAGFELPPGDDGRLAVLPPPEPAQVGPYVVLHPGASVPARAWSPRRCAEAVVALTEAGHRVLVTGGPSETALTAEVAGAHGVDLGGRTTFAELAGLLARADAVVVGNTGPAHLAAAVGTPVVSLFAPVVPAARWAPHGRHVLLGDQDAPCRGTRARDCPVAGHPCLDRVSARDVVAAVTELVGVRA
ncbi:glycosyltransferase family 9 protein [Saccharothrix coeruleofusca]|uniref:Glycosyl transferase n=1 Tax=Saccharothrix coeruleofusca TaxID=33919 RepID=A0A918AQW3_9PSEU|nr:glycosyltransferase family 9 protein [Saccharothrix coeruleofusca]MBP2335277.1 ADP-heptose:LPS heptosyltransferase [Saccharothrix coeruleofusca]GGP71931.1 glycosyl transferase [Saccharothrix coeruleofusca]